MFPHESEDCTKMKFKRDKGLKAIISLRQDFFASRGHYRSDIQTAFSHCL